MFEMGELISPNVGMSKSPLTKLGLDALNCKLVMSFLPVKRLSVRSVLSLKLREYFLVKG